MKLLLRLTIGLLILLTLFAIASLFFISSKAPKLEGKLKLDGLENKVEVFFDEYGIPHIYAQNEADAYYGLGYIHAQDRLFQMELLRRLGRGQLAEILGPDLAETDRFFRTIGIEQTAQKANKVFFEKSEDDPIRIAAEAYYQGINSFIDNGATPFEFHILGIEKRPFTVEDGYAIFGYMAFSFAQAFRTDPLLTRIHQKLGEEYMNDLDVHWDPNAQMIPVHPIPSTEPHLGDAFDVTKLFETFPAPPFVGSNAWVIGPSKTKSGQVILSNDTHIGFAQPSVWYEAHIECPGTSLYANYLGGVPFGVIGNNRFMSWGFTMLENDDIDFYVEKVNPDNPNQVLYEGNWVDVEVRTETVKVKDGDDLTFEVQTTRHGPIINEAIEDVSKTTEERISLWWIYNEFLPKNFESTYQLGKAQTIEEVQKAAAVYHSPGLNLMYGDTDGNIAWWAIGKLPKRPAHVNSKLFLDGTTSRDEILGWFDFKDNPHSVNPPEGYVYTANNQPDTLAATLHAGYYIPEDRARRIMTLLEAEDQWDVEAVQNMVLDTKSPTIEENTAVIVEVLENSSLEESEMEALNILKEWNYENQLSNIAPTIYTKIIYHILEKSFLDELGEADFNTFLETHMYKRTYPIMLQNPSSIWWDDVNTESNRESRSDIILAAFQQSIPELEAQLGSDKSQWLWSKVHTIEHPHLLGSVESLRSWFNVGPLPVPGTNEVLNNMAFHHNPDGKYEVAVGPAKRRIIDFADLEHSVSILPTGQSGNPKSPHYDDQAEMFVEGKFRLQKMNRKEIEKGKRLMLVPRRK